MAVLDGRLHLAARAHLVLLRDSHLPAVRQRRVSNGHVSISMEIQIWNRKASLFFVQIYATKRLHFGAILHGHETDREAHK